MIDNKTDIVGNRYGRLVVLSRAENYICKNGKIKTRWLCKCDCGNEVVVMRNSLVSGLTKSCGCLRKETSSALSRKTNQYDLSGDFGIGYDSKGNEFYFDLEDYDLIKDIYWYLNNHGYIMSSKNIMLHKLLFPNAEIIDHINHKKYDNRKCNLREVTQQQNNMNSIKPKNNTSGVKGVVWHKGDERWQAQITINNKCLYLGSYLNKEDAIKARKEAEEKYFGEYSYDNSMRLEEMIC